jgi:integrase
MRLMECVRLRVKDLDFGKGGKDRRVPLPAKFVEELKAHLVRVRGQYEVDLMAGFGAIMVAAAGKLQPHFV